MRSHDEPTAREDRFLMAPDTTIRVTDYQTRPATRTSWSEVQIHREEVRLPNAGRTERR